VSEEVLWYIARISGLLAWILSFGALSAGLLARSEPAHGTSAGLWAADTRNLLGRLSVVGLAVHAAATAASDRFGLDLQSVLTGRAEGQWLVTAAVVGVACGWAIVGAELARLVPRRISGSGDLLLLAVAAATVAAGGYHGWQLGSDTQNPLAIAVMVLSGLLLLGSAAIGLTSFLDDQDPLVAAAPSLAAEGENLVLSNEGTDAEVVAGNGVSESTDHRPLPVDAGLSVSLSRTIAPRADEQEDRGMSETLRGPQIASARDISPPLLPPSTNAAKGQISGAWSMRKLPDAPKPAHRKAEES
jgi:hypothetical protein